MFAIYFCISLMCSAAANLSLIGASAKSFQLNTTPPSITTEIDLTKEPLSITTEIDLTKNLIETTKTVTEDNAWMFEITTLSLSTESTDFASTTATSNPTHETIPPTKSSDKSLTAPWVFLILLAVCCLILVIGKLVYDRRHSGNYYTRESFSRRRSQELRDKFL